MSELIYAGLLMFIACLILGFINTSKIFWTTGLIITAILVNILTNLGWFYLSLFWFLITVVVLILVHDRIRKKIIIRKIFALFRSQIPTMSITEQEALEAGGIGWESELFSGKPDWEQLRQYKPNLSAEEQAYLDGPVETLCHMLDDWQISHQLHDLPEIVWDFIRKEKFFCMIIPKEQGGLGFSAQGHSAVVIKLASRSITAAVTVMVPNSLGPGQLLIEYGTEAQKARYLPGLVNGEDIPCFALTAPEAGSDATSMKDHGIVCQQAFNGEENVLGIRLNWSKRYITLGPVATLLGLAFKLYDPNHLLGDEENIGITLALIPTDTPGIEIGRRHMPGAIPFQNGPNSGKDVFIPIDWIIGGPNYAGKGWRMLVECLSEGRGISLPALSTAASKLASHTSSTYARVRQQFHHPIAMFEGVEEVLARIVGKTYLMEGARQLTLTMLDSGVSPSVATAIVKYHLTEMMRENINDAMDIHGGKAIMLGPNNYLMRTYQALPISITVEGANILTRNMIIFGQGAIRCHPCLSDEILAASEGEKGLNAFDDALGKHISHAVGNFSRAFLLGLSRGYLTRGSAEHRKMTRLSAALAFSAELTLMLLGGQIKRRERLSARLGDALSYLYLGTAAIHLFENNGSIEEEKPLCEWAVSYAAFKTQEALLALSDNLPGWAGIIIKWVCFPFGRSYKLPSDKLDHRLAKTILSPNSTRNQLISGIYFPEADDQALSQLQQAFDLAIDCEPIEDKLHQARRKGILDSDDIEIAIARNVINKDEAKKIRQANDARMKVINVDDFATEDYAGVK